MDKCQHLDLINKCFQGSLVRCGYRQRGQRIFAQVIDNLRLRIKEDPIIVIYNLLNKVKPSVNLWTKKRGGTSYKLPYLISDKKALSMATHWLVKEASLRPERTMADRLSMFILESVRGRNRVLRKKRIEIHKIALLNRPYLRK